MLSNEIYARTAVASVGVAVAVVAAENSKSDLAERRRLFKLPAAGFLSVLKQI